MKFIVTRSKWYRGLGSTNSRLLKQDGRRCCIGFVGQQCGIPDSDLLDRSTVRSHELNSREHADKWPKWFTEKDTSGFYDWLVGEAYDANDSQEISNEEREIKLKEIFTKYGDEIEFVD